MMTAPAADCDRNAFRNAQYMRTVHSNGFRQSFNAGQIGRCKRPPFAASCRRQHTRSIACVRQANQWLVCRAQSSPQDTASVPDGSVSLVLLAGGVGKRMGAPIPKQYLEILGQPIATYSLQTFSSMREVGEIVVVCEDEHKQVFSDAMAKLPAGDSKPLSFAKPGKERQDSVYNGFQAISADAALVAIHDSARPLVTAEDTTRCLQDAMQVGAAVLGVAVKPTIKEVDVDGSVVKTLQRSRLVEVQTPQVIKPALLTAGFELVQRESLEVTDDVSIIEALGEPVKITYGSYSNIKVTTPDDMSVAEGFLKEHCDGAMVHA